jgi:predicted CoA-binding protein
LNQQLIASFLDRGNIFAVVGVSRDPAKYGHQLYKELRSAGYRVYAVNPNTSEVLGDRCYPSLEALPVKPDVVVFVVPPRVTEAAVKTCKKLGVKRVWMQPGSESEAAIDFCRRNGIDVIYGVCVMVERRNQQK